MSNAASADRSLMRRALELAGRGWGRVHPNPLVGAVVAHGSEVVGEGYHAEYGGPHAEVEALRAAGERARGATLYVTLEPCAHHGQTPPCTDAVIEAGVRRVVIAAEDPNAEAAGGIDRLRGAGVEVVTGVERDAARAQNAVFIHAHEQQAPYVALKYALSLDARLSEMAGRPSAVTGPAALREAHRLRAGYDAILAGIGTALADDPLLTVRGPVTPRVVPARVIVDTDARLPLDSRLVRTIDEAPLLVLCGHDAPDERVTALEAAGAEVLQVDTRVEEHGAEHESVTAGGRADGVRDEGEVSSTRPGLAAAAILERLAEHGVRSVFCEGGGRLGSSLLEADLVERMYLFYAPKLFGASGTPAFVGNLGVVNDAADARGGGSASGQGVEPGWSRGRLAALDDDVLMVLDRRR